MDLGPVCLAVCPTCFTEALYVLCITGFVLTHGVDLIKRLCHQASPWGKAHEYMYDRTS